jgi:peptidoglycan/LPS O-acetylase OafA/YrhL
VEQTTRPKYRRDIDGMRAIAVLSVVGFHARPNLFPGGFVGVDVFFVISGFLISTIIFGNLEAGRFDMAGFYGRRIRRIFPALAVVLLASLALGWFVLLATDYEELGKQIAAGAGFVSNILFLHEAGYFDTAAQYKPLLHLWSLGIEEQFYIVWPFLLWSAWKQNLNLLAVTTVVASISFWLNVRGMDDVAWAYYSPVTRFWALLMGAVLAYATLHKKRLRIRTRQYLTMARQFIGSSPNYFTPQFVGPQAERRLGALQSVLGLILVLQPVFGLGAETAYSPWLILLPTLGTVLLISAGPQAPVNRVILSHSVMVWFGLISFPLYLWHWPLLSFASIMEPAQAFGLDPPRISGALAAVLVTLSVALAWLTYQFIERPVRFGRPRGIVPALCLSTLTVGGMGYLTFIADGFPFRYTEKPWMRQVGAQLFVREWRAHECFLEIADDFAGNCADLDKRPLYFLWGDSQAAALYPGLKSLQQRTGIGIAQYGSTACPPLVDFVKLDRPRCKELNTYILDRIQALKPEVVLLQANWIRSNIGHYDLGKIEVTVRELRRLGVNRIILFGPGPIWSAPLPRLIWTRYHALHRAGDGTPLRMDFGIDPDVSELDGMMQMIASRLGITYISIFRTMCNSSGCLVRVDNEEGDLTFYDTMHLSPAGSRLLFRLISDKVF